MAFEIYPTLDIRGGRVVDLVQGDFARETVFPDSAAAVAKRFLDDGARWLQIVDLDGSRVGTPTNRQLVEELAALAAARGAKSQLGGGIRSLDAVEAALRAGFSRVTLGTAAAERPDLVADAVRHFGAEAIVVAIDGRHGRVVVRGWTESRQETVVGAALQIADLGVRYVIHTDVLRDSTLSGPNLPALQRLLSATEPVCLQIIASGGITTAAQVSQIARLGAAGAAIGGALYAGRMTVRDALEAARGFAN